MQKERIILFYSILLYFNVIYYNVSFDIIFHIIMNDKAIVSNIKSDTTLRLTWT